MALKFNNQERVFLRALRLILEPLPYHPQTLLYKMHLDLGKVKYLFGADEPFLQLLTNNKLIFLAQFLTLEKPALFNFSIL